MKWEGEEKPLPNPESAQQKLPPWRRFLVGLAGPFVEHKPPLEKTTERVECFRAICRALVVDENIDAFNRAGLATAEEQQFFLEAIVPNMSPVPHPKYEISAKSMASI